MTVFALIQLLLILLLPPLTLLYILGRQRRLRPPLPPPPTPHLSPRRLSFSTPTSGARRRVTFSLTPEQARNEYLKTEVRRRESLQEHTVEATDTMVPKVVELFPKLKRVYRTVPQPRPVSPPIVEQPIVRKLAKRTVVQPMRRELSEAESKVQRLTMRRRPVYYKDMLS